MTITNFPNQGDDKKITIANSKYPQFDYQFAKKIKENYTELWNRYATGGKGEDKTDFTGGDAFNSWTKYRQNGGQEEWIKRRERYFNRFASADNSIANAIGHIKWGGYTSNFNESEIKKVVNNKIKEMKDDIKKTEQEDIIIKSCQEDIKFDEVKGIFHGFGIVFNEPDSINDIAHENSIDNSLELWKNNELELFINYEHENDIRLCKNIDFAEKRTENGRTGLYIEAKIPEETKEKYPDLYKDLVSFAKNGDLGFSIEGSLKSNSLGIQKRKQSKLAKMTKEEDILYDINLKGFALTKKPSFKNCVAIVKGFLDVPKYRVDIENDWDEQGANKRWREYSNSTEAPSKTYKKGFLYIDNNGDDKYGSYHFQVVDIVDDEPVVNARSVIAIYSYLNGARRGIKILNEGERITLLKVIKELYKRINRIRKENDIEELPEPIMKSEDMIFSDILNTITGEVSLEKFIKENLNYSNGQAKKFANRLKEILIKKNLDNDILEVNKEDKAQVNEPSASQIPSETGKSFYKIIANKLK